MKPKKQPEQLDLFRDFCELEPDYEQPSAEDLADMRECLQALKKAVYNPPKQ